MSNYYRKMYSASGFSDFKPEGWVVAYQCLFLDIVESGSLNRVVVYPSHPPLLCLGAIRILDTSCQRQKALVTLLLIMNDLAG